MKIIAKISEETRLVEITKSELAKLVGYSSSSDLPHKYNSPSCEVGDEYNISETYRAITDVVRKSRFNTSCDSIEQIRNELREVDKNLEIIQKGIQPISQAAKDLK